MSEEMGGSKIEALYVQFKRQSTVQHCIFVIVSDCHHQVDVGARSLPSEERTPTNNVRMSACGMAPL